MTGPRKPTTVVMTLSSAPSRNGTRSSPRLRADGQAVRMTSVHLPAELLRRATVQCAEREETFSGLVERLLVAELEREPRRAG